MIKGKCPHKHIDCDRHMWTLPFITDNEYESVHLYEFFIVLSTQYLYMHIMSQDSSKHNYK